jgi:hypothetical protein
MTMKKLVTVACAGLMAASAMAETNAADATTTANTATTTTAKKKKKIIQKKSLSRKGAETMKAAKEDHLTQPAQAASTSAATATTSMPAFTAGTTTAEAPTAVVKKKSIADRLRAGVQFEYSGSSIADPLNGEQTDHSTGFGEGAFPAELDTRVTAGYALSDQFTISYNAYFWSYADSAANGKGETFGFRPGDSYLKLGVGKFYQAGNFKWDGDFRLYPGLGKDYDQVVARWRTGQNLHYSVTPRLTIAAYNTIRYYQRTETAYQPDKDKSGKKIDFRVTLGPAVEYQLFDKAGVSLSYNMDLSHAHNNNTFDSTSNLIPEPDAGFYRAYFELGGMIDVTKAVYFNPYIDAYTQAFNTDAMQLGANLAITFL